MTASVGTPSSPSGGAASWDERATQHPHPIRALLIRRIPLAVLTVFVVSIIVYLATHILPGDAATAILGREATPQRLAALRQQLGLNHSAIVGYAKWLGPALHGDFGQSLSESRRVTTIVGEPIENSLVLVLTAALISSVLGIVLGMQAAHQKDGAFDTVVSVVALVASSLPEYVIGILVIIAFSVNVFQWFPALSLVPPGTPVWSAPTKLVLPVATLVLVVSPYVFRMTRGTMIEALGSDFVELARLKGVPRLRLSVVHALPNALPPVIQAIGLNLLYLAGGIVLVEYVFDYPGVGNLLVSAVTQRDVPLIQFLVVALAAFYVSVNIITDVLVLLVTPRRRYPR